MARFELGTVSEGTLRSEDLLPVFADALRGLAGDDVDAEKLLLDADTFDWDTKADWIASRAYHLIEMIDLSINGYCPPFVYFGSLEGDGADFGFWPDHDAIQEAQQYGTVYEADREYIYSDDHGVWIHVNDHGNVMVLTDDDGKPGNEIWSAV